MVEAQRIECDNRAAFVMSFKVASAQRMTTSSGNYPVLQSRTLDLAASTFPEGITVWPVVSAVLGKTVASDDRITFKLNGKTAVYKVSGTTQSFSVVYTEVKDDPGKRPPGFPPQIPVNRVPFVNWDGTIDLPEVWTCAPRSGEEVVAACNWAQQNGYQVRPRGIIHNWSPLSLPPQLAKGAKVLTVDTTKALNGIAMLAPSGPLPARVRVGAGATMGDLLAFLEAQSGGGGGAPGFSFPHTPAPDHLTVGGVLAINGHGSAVRTPPNDDLPASYGSMSNRILELVAVATDPDAPSPGPYRLQTFQRGGKDTTALLTQLGRSLVVEATLQVVANYNLRCQSFTDIPASVLFAPTGGGPPPAKSLGQYLAQSGRVEAIWYPFSDNPWLKVWSVVTAPPAGSRRVDQPNNYPFSDNLEPEITDLIKKIVEGLPGLTPIFGKTMEKATELGLDGKNMLGQKVYPVSRDIWGPSKNTLFYVKDTTLRVTANGYAILMRKADVQDAVADFAKQFETMLAAYQSRNQFPINAPLEIRVTGLDSPEHVPAVVGNAPGRPVISSLATDAETVRNGWDVALWLDVLTLPGTKHSDSFFAELEAWFLQRFKGTQARVLPEWSKGWAYTPTQGAWSDASFFKHIRQAFTTARAGGDDWRFEVATLGRYDRHGLFKSPLLERLFVDPT